MKTILKNRQGEGFVDVCVLVLAIVIVLTLFMKVTPVFLTKHSLDMFAVELARSAEIAGNVGTATTARANHLTQETGLSPRISWSRTGNIQIGQDVTVTVSTDVNIGLFGDFGSFPITLTSKATGKSEVYHK